MTSKLSIALYPLKVDGSGIITWQAPDGNPYTLDPRGAPAGQWKYTDDQNGNHVMAYMSQPPKTGDGYMSGLGYPEENPSGDGVLVLSLRGAPGIAATLLHSEDDVADRRYYIATDGGNNNPLDPTNKAIPALILRAAGISQSPVKPWSYFQVLVIG